MTKYIAYCRKSTDEKDRQVLSIEAQIAELKEFAKREKLHIVETLVESKTAKEPGRFVFQQMMKLLESGRANAILSWHPFMSTPLFDYGNNCKFNLLPDEPTILV